MGIQTNSVRRMGSRSWVTEVFNSPPAREVKGRSRPTQRYVARDDAGQISYAEGGNTAVARLILTTMQNAGIVESLKLEPFRLNLAEHGVEAVPDLMFKMNDGRVFVVETKSARYLTQEKLDGCEAVEKVINAAGMKYLFWTDRWPLTSDCWRLMRQTRRYGMSNIDGSLMSHAIDVLRKKSKTLGELRADGIFSDVVRALVWSGQLHMNLFAEPSDTTVVSVDPADRRFESVLHAPVR